MPRLPRIPNPDGGTTIPAVDARTYPDLFVSNITMDLYRPDPFLKATLRQYNYDRDEFEPDGKCSLIEKDFYAWAGAPRANPEAPTLREQWLGLGVALVALENTLTFTEGQAAPLAATLADRQAALDVAIATEDAAGDSLAAAEVSLKDAQVAQAELSEQATEEEKATAQAVVDAAVAGLESWKKAVETAKDAIVQATADRDAAAVPAQAAQSAVDAIKARIGIV
jgi:hypothetical protein